MSDADEFTKKVLGPLLEAAGAPEAAAELQAAMAPDLQPFDYYSALDTGEQCPKCDVQDPDRVFAVQYCFKCETYPTGEHMHRWCMRCGYAWLSYCVDADQQSA